MSRFLGTAKVLRSQMEEATVFRLSRHVLPEVHLFGRDLLERLVRSKIALGGMNGAAASADWRVEHPLMSLFVGWGCKSA
jgi:hypothetical protein